MNALDSVRTFSWSGSAALGGCAGNQTLKSLHACCSRMLRTCLLQASIMPLELGLQHGRRTDGMHAFFGSALRGMADG